MQRLQVSGVKDVYSEQNLKFDLNHERSSSIEY